MKTVAISLGIGAILSGGFSRTFASASKGVSALSNEIINLKNSQRSLAQYNNDKKSLLDKAKTIKNTKLAISELKKSMEEEENQTDENKKALENLEKKLVSLQKTFQKEASSLRDTSKVLKEKKINLENTAEAYKKLEKNIKIAEKAALKYRKAESLNELGGKISKIGGTALKHGAVGLAVPGKLVQSAIKAEANFADVKKQFDFSTKEDEEKFKRDLHKIITEKKIAISLEELYGAAASAGQSGLKEDEAIKYIELASKVGMAFDMSREDAAKSMFEIKNALNLPYEDLVKLTDQMNYLGNTTGASATNIVEFVNRVGSIGKLAGFSDGAVSAIGATLIEKGMDTERAATGAKKIFNTLTKGNAVSKKQLGVFSELGLNPVELAKLSQKNAEKAMSILFKSISKKSKYEQGAILFQLFGEEGKEAAAKLLTDLDRVNENLRKINSLESKGSVDKEADIKRNTVKNQIEILKGKASIIGSQLGTLLLPEVNKLVNSFSNWLTKLSELQEKHPKLFSSLIKFLAYGSVSLIGFGGGLKFIAGGIKAYSNYLKIAGFITENQFGLKTLSTVKKVTGGVRKLIKGFKTFGLSLLTNPLTWYIAAVLGIVAAGYLLYKNWDKVKEKTVELREKIANLVDRFWYLIGPLGWIIKGGMELYRNWDKIKEKATELKEKIVNMIENIVLKWQEFKQSSKDILGNFFDWIEEKWNSVKDIGANVLDFYLGIIEKISNGLGGLANFLGIGNEPKSTLPGRNIPRYANGGVVSSPTLALIGEGNYPETIIPHNNSERSFNLWEKTGRLIGAYDKINNSSSNTTIEFSFNPVIYTNNSGVREEVEKAKDNAFTEFKIMMEKYENEKKRRGYGR